MIVPEYFPQAPTAMVATCVGIVESDSSLWPEVTKFRDQANDPMSQKRRANVLSSADKSVRVAQKARHARDDELGLVEGRAMGETRQRHECTVPNGAR